MPKKTITLATRESQLALWQANWVKNFLEQAHANLSIELLGITTQADRLPYISLQEIGGKGLFVKELEEALLSKRADIAVHSLKDMPVNLPPGLCLAAFCKRANPHDVLVSNNYATIESLPINALIGTSSLRRSSQLLNLRQDLVIKPLRGNINTRLSRLDNGDFSAIILAAAGLERLDFKNRIQNVLPFEQFLPAAGQGILGVECRDDDQEIKALLTVLNHSLSESYALAERAVNRELGANCQVPVAAFATTHENQLWVRGLVASKDGKIILRAEVKGNVDDAEFLGITVGKDLLDKGAEEVLKL